jgi:hypothetical protein
MTHGELAVILQGHGMRVRARPGGFQAQCPAHDDRKRKRALSGTLGRDGRQLLHCHAGCGFEEVHQALGLPVEAFFGWDAYNHKRLRSTSPASPVTLIISGVSVLHAKRLLASGLKPMPVALPVPPRAGRVTRAIADDMGVLFGLADAAGAVDVPLMYSARWGAKRLDTDVSSSARSLRTLVQYGAIVRAKGVPSWHGRATRTYRRAGP